MTGQGASYFFLSYAHSPPLPGSPAVPVDEWVRGFYRDLSNRVRRHAAPGTTLQAGFIDMEIPLGTEWKTALVTALGAAEVFVPLYSPGYLTRSWPGREWACFETRMRLAGLPDPLRRFAPVLWVPLPSGQRPRGYRQAEDLAPPDVREPYLDNGLLALQRLRPYRPAYLSVLDELARRIVRLAEDDRIGPSQVPDIEQVDSAFRPSAQTPLLAVAVAAPVSGKVPAGARPGSYGKSAAEWRPFSEEKGAAPLAEYARMVGEQLDFSVEVTDLASAGELAERGPGIVLIDPFTIAAEADRSALEAYLDQMPSWVLPVLGPATGPVGERLAQQLRGMLTKQRPSVTRQVRRGMRGVTSLRQFTEELLPYLVAEAGREYLRRGPVEWPSPRPPSRPSLAGSGWRSEGTEDDSALYGEEHNPAKERPDDG